MKIKKIAILTSGGDAPGMNAALFGAFEACLQNSVKLYGVIGGYDGLIDNKIKLLTYQDFEGRINDGGSIIKSSRSKRFKQSTYFKRAIKNLKDNNIDALIILGGDGSARGAHELTDQNIKTILIPSTIDNDMNFNYTLGFDTARNNIVKAIDQIIDCLSSFQNYGAVINIMGHDCPDLINSIANACHIKYVVYNKEENVNLLAKKIKSDAKKCCMPAIVLVLENCIDTSQLSNILEEKTNIHFRPHILGYAQRGGAPTAFDRIYGYNAGALAVTNIINNKSGFTIGYDSNNQLVEKSFYDSILR